MSMTVPFVPFVDEAMQDNGVVHVPAGGFTRQFVAIFMIGLVFGGAGAAGWAICVNKINAVPIFTFWFVVGVFGVFFVGGVGCLGIAVLELLRRFEFQADGEALHRVAIIGPFRRRRAWPRAEIAGLTLRHAAQNSIGGPRSNLVLVFADGRNVPILHFRLTSSLIPIEAALQYLLDASPPRALDAPPLGGGLNVSDTDWGLHIMAGPIRPSMVPGQLYGVGTACAYGNPVFSALLTAAGWKQVQGEGVSFAAMFWCGTVVQMLAFTVGGIALRRWIRRIAGRCYKITIDRMQVTIVANLPKQTKTEQCFIADVRDVECVAVVNENDLPMLVRLDLVTNAGKRIELLFGRPPEETAWIRDRVRREIILRRAALTTEPR